MNKPGKSPKTGRCVRSHIRWILAKLCGWVPVILRCLGLLMSSKLVFAMCASNHAFDIRSIEDDKNWGVRLFKVVAQ